MITVGGLLDQKSSALSLGKVEDISFAAEDVQWKRSATNAPAGSHEKQAIDREYVNHAESGLLDYRNTIAGNTVVGYGRGNANLSHRL